MHLEKYNVKDAEFICSWFNDEKNFYQWSADRFNKFPVSSGDLNAYYLPLIEDDAIIALCAHEGGKTVGFMIIRYPNKTDKSTVRFGFIIVDSRLRGRGYGTKMLGLAANYAKNTLGAEKVTLGVFENNENARRCYESFGFNYTGEKEVYSLPLGEWLCAEMELLLG